MVINMSELIKLIQDIEMDALYEFKKICDIHNIKFYLRGGSVMGAVKYGGFVPWDDDIDVAVPRSDYERLIEFCKDKVIADKYIINSYKFCEKLHCYFPRMSLVESERIQLGLPKNTNLGLHLMDIFPLDGAPNHVILRKLYFIKVYFFRTLASIGTQYEDNMKNMHTKKQQIVIDFLRFFKIDKLIVQQKIYDILDKIYIKNSFENSRYAGTITASLISKEVMRKEIWGEGIHWKFGDINVRIPSLYDEYLKKMYGANYLYEEPTIKKTHI